ncbi:MAG: SRPBCC family protein [bacterium]
MGSSHLLERRQTVPQPLDRVFPFFADAGNLQAITPAFLHFRFRTPLPIEMRPGALIDYEIRLFGAPMRWRTRIAAFEPPHRFVDEQLRGPYRTWVHTHEFHEVEGGTLIVDRVQYQLPLGLLGDLAHALWVRRTLERIFDHRGTVIAERFGRA